MATQEKTWNVANRMHSQKDSDNPEVNHIIAGADEIYDDEKGAKQSEINAQTDAALADRYTKEETYSKEQLDALITTPDANYVTVATFADLPQTGEGNTVYRVSSYDGTQVDASKYALYAWNGTSYQMLAVRSAVGEVFDVSEYNSGATYETLTAALAAVPASVQRGGMSIKFILRTNTGTEEEPVYHDEYVQYRLMSTDWSTVITDWQGVDKVPTPDSDNLVRSGGVQNELALGAVYDVSAKNPTAGPNNDGKFESLSALLSDNNLNILIPTAVRKGGMSIKFVHSSDNKYVQYMYMAASISNAVFTNIANWQGVDVKDANRIVDIPNINVLKALNTYSTAKSWRLITSTSTNKRLLLCGFKIYRGEKVRVYYNLKDGFDLAVNINKEDISRQLGDSRILDSGWLNDTGSYEVAFPSSYIDKDYAYGMIAFRKHDESVDLTPNDIDTILNDFSLNYVRFVTVDNQSLTNTEKKQIRANLGFGNGDIDTTPTKNSDRLVTSDGVAEELALGAVWDVTLHNNNATFDSLSALLSNNELDILIPVTVRKIGMSIKFEQSIGNNKYVYVQFRYMGVSLASAVFTNISNWQGVDDEPITNSNNLVKSAGIARKGVLTSIEAIRVLYVKDTLPLTIVDNNNSQTRAGFTSIKVNKGEFLYLDLSVADGYDAILQMTDNDMRNTTNHTNPNWIAGWYDDWTAPKHIIGYFAIPESYTAQNYSYIQIWFRKHDDSTIVKDDVINYAVEKIYMSVGVDSPTDGSIKTNGLSFLDATESEAVKLSKKYRLRYNGGTIEQPLYTPLGELIIPAASNSSSGLFSSDKKVQLDMVAGASATYDVTAITMTEGGAVNGKFSVGDVITSGLTVVSTSSYKYAIVECKEGEKYTVSSESSSYTYVAMFIASHFPAVNEESEYYKMRTVVCNRSASKGLTKNILVEIPPLEQGSDKQYLIINDNRESETVSYKGVTSQIKNNNAINESLFRNILTSSDIRYYNASANYDIVPYWLNSLTRIATGFVRIHPNDVLKIKQGSSVKVSCRAFDKYYNSIPENNIGWKTNDINFGDFNGYYSFILAFTDDSTIDDSNRYILENAISIIGEYSSGLKTINGQSIGGNGNIVIQTEQGTGILDFNPDTEFVNKLRQMKRQPRIGGIPQPVSAPITPFVLAHFSDIHTQTSNLSRIVEFCTHHNSLIDDVICSGDMVSYFTNGMDWWKTVSGSQNILTCIGNHEPRVGDNWTAKTMAECYEEFMYGIANWGVQYQANKTYYYKDYSNAKVRLIVVDCIHWDTDQSDWFSGLLVSAQLNGLSVVVVSHYKPTLLDGFDCPFNNIQQFNDTAFITQLASIVDLFTNGTLTAIVGGETTSMTGNGEFVCYLSGHTHIDQIGVLQNYQNQLNISIDCAAANNQSGYSDIARVENSKSFDLFNLVAVDTYQKLVKIARVGANIDSWLREKDMITVQYTSSLAKTVSKPTIIT